ncbi:Myelodysplasia-myeloid leukemia factor 1-interacting protein [Pycnococcus provasolii]
MATSRYPGRLHTLQGGGSGEFPGMHSIESLGIHSMFGGPSAMMMPGNGAVASVVNGMMNDMANVEREMDNVMARAFGAPRRAAVPQRHAARDLPTTATAAPGSTRGFSSSSVSYRSYGGPSGVEYTSTTNGVTDARGETITETRRTYRDGSGFEKLGVSRTLGSRGRNVVRERDGSTGAERATDTLLGLSEAEKSSFDGEWRARAEAAQLPRGAPTMPSMALPSFSFGGMRMVPERPPPTLEERQAARAGRRAFEEQTARVLEEARRQRPPAVPAESRRRRVPLQTSVSRGLGAPPRPRRALPPMQGVAPPRQAPPLPPLRTRAG